ncbi:MAG: BrnA antitoxin family protein [Thiotrichales bacterium]|mgnify:CR=1 FL=1|jgi:uncharacterized protein (DUF4415 family)|nr:BrnA antitoxin family protein [Thiotrichales bacterium]MBT7314684.1 BrnA antitoxin family protein [Thiotrichales bacterium]
MQNHVITNFGRKITLNSEEEDVAINSGIASDPDTYELSGVEFENLRPVGRPKSEMTKDKITIRLSNEVTTYFRALGKGWQTHMNEVLREYVSKHPV